MNYTIEIEENERTLEFTLSVRFGKDPIFEDAYLEFDIEAVDVCIDTNDFLNPVDEEVFESDHKLFYLVEEAYKSKIELMLEEDDKLLEAWKKHVEEV